MTAAPPKPQSVLRGPSLRALAQVRDYNHRAIPTFLMTTLYIAAETTKLALVFARMVSAGDGREHKSFFCNSGLEALSGAIKLARHNACNDGRGTDKSVVVYDPGATLVPFFNPTRRDPAQALAAGLVFVEELEQVPGMLDEHRAVALVHVTSEKAADAERERVECSARWARERGVLLIVDEREISASGGRLGRASVDADIYVFGETVTDSQIPFGAFVSTPEAWAPWSNIVDSMVHTSTFGANGLACSFALDWLRECGYVPDEMEPDLRRIDHDHEFRVDRFHRYVNPWGVTNLGISDLDFTVRHARGIDLELETSEHLIDVAGNAGCSLRGHNPPDLLAGAIDSFDPDRDYCQELERDLLELSGFDQCFFAVSGATAVDTGLLLASLARPHLTKIVSFSGNYSGKTLISQNLSITERLLRASKRDAFTPYYFDIEHINPFRQGAAQRLAECLGQGDVALVWLELIQGSQCRPIPQEILDVINDHRTPEGFLVGVDEILTGYWRTGRFLAHEGRLLDVDIVTLGKQLGDMTFPISATLVRDDLVDHAIEEDSGTVELLRRHYRCQLGAAIALNGLNQVREGGEIDALAGRMARYRRGLEEIVAESRLLEEVRGEGNLLRLKLSTRAFPFEQKSPVTGFFEQYTASYLRRRAGLLVFMMRLNLPTFATDEMVDDVLARMKKALVGTSPVRIYTFAATRLLRYAARSARRRVRRAIRSL